MRKKPLVSVILPVYNGEKYLARAIESVRRQTFRNWELIIVDDCSRDSSSAIARVFRNKDNRIRVLGNPGNRGLVYSLNRAIKSAKGKYIARIDHDDEWINSRKIESQLKVFFKNQETVIVGTGVYIENERGKLVRTPETGLTDSEIRRLMLFRNPFIHPSVMFQKASAKLAGLYSENPKYVEDYHLWLELGKYGLLENLPYKMVRVRELDKGISRSHFWLQYYGCIKLVWRYRNDYPHGLLALFKNLTERFLGFVYKPFKGLWIRGLN